MSGHSENFAQLELEAVIGFNGHVFNGLHVHPDREHIIYPLGCTIILKSLTSGKQEFLQGHTNNVSCVSVSKSGNFLASGQVTFMGFLADIIIWDYAKKALHARLCLHNAKVEDLSFSLNDKFLVSLGGQDDGSIIVWNVETGEAICGSPASPQRAGQTLAVRFTNLDDEIFISAGSDTVRVWKLDVPSRKIRPTECNLGQFKRVIKCIVISEDDTICYCGTSSGDVLKINIGSKLLNSCYPEKNKFTLGVSTVKMTKTGDVLVGSGNGTIFHCLQTNFKVSRKIQLDGGVTSIALRGEGHQFFVGTDTAEIYRFDYLDFKEELISTSHASCINCVVFPSGSSELFVTCSLNDIRVWHADTSKEKLRITVPNMTCNAVEITIDGRNILSAWNDGKIRVFTPETGTLSSIIHNAHSMGVTAIASTRDCKRIISGGGEGQVRMWQFQNGNYHLMETMKEHKAVISAVKIKSNDKECATASWDGTCIIWDLVRFKRLQMVLANSLFKALCYHPDEYQFLTGGTDRKIGFWEVYDGSPIKELLGSLSGAINCMCFSSEGKYFATGGEEKLVKLWGFTDGKVTHVGSGHSGSITSIRICPNNRYIVSTSADGAVLRWKYPHAS